MKSLKIFMILVAIVSLGCVGPGLKLGPYTLTPMATVETIGVEVTKTDSGDLVGTFGPTFQAVVDQFTGVVETIIGGSD